MGNINFSGKRIREIEEKLQGHKSGPQEYYKLLDHSDFLRLFRISVRTSVAWRNKKWIPYYKIGKNIFFRVQDVEEFLEKHLKK